jgi:redox-sensitive bicupin YhaK (pirin superfamily)
VGIIGPGDVQWMTSGRGIMHEEMPRRGPSGVINGFQLWVNLPAVEKMSQPRYQEVTADTIPMVENEGVKIRVVAGEYNGSVGPVTEIAAKPLYMDVTLEPNTKFSLPVTEGHALVTYVFEGAGYFGLDVDGVGEHVSTVKVVVFKDGDYLVVRSGPDEYVRFMLMAGGPFNEPIAPYGPFVMNTPEEIRQAFEDLRNGTFVQG